MQDLSYVYILESLSDKRLYVGYTKNLRLRLKKHKYGEVISTRDRRPLKLVYWEECENRYEGRKREKYLKSLYGAREKKKLVDGFHGKTGRL
jgi:putative endonuclease